MEPALAQSLRLLLAGCLLSLFSMSGIAQQKYSYSFLVPPGITKYTQQNAIDVGDVPGHQIRIAEIQIKFASEAPEFAGVKVLENWARLTSDYINGNGTYLQYNVLLMTNGDKIFQRTEGVTHTYVNQDGARMTAYSNVHKITGGTGKFAGIRGLLRSSGTSDFKTLRQNPTEGEYWFEQ